MGAGAAFPRTALLRENKACTLSAESFSVPICPNSVDAVRAESAPPVTRITGKIGRIQGEIPVIRPPSMPRMMSDNSIVILPHGLVMRGDAASRVVMVIFGTNCGFGLVEIIFIAMPAQLTAS